MAQHDYVIDNSTGANVRADINSVLQAIASNNSGSSAPSTTFGLQTFANTTNSMLQLRNSANNAFVNLRKFDGSLPLPDGSASSPSLFFDDDTNTGCFSSAADKFNISTAGIERVEFGATTIFNETGADVDFRIEGDTESSLFYVDAGNDRVGIGTNTPSSKAHFFDSTDNSILLLQSGDANCRLDLKDNAGQCGLMAAGNDLVFTVNSAINQAARIDSSQHFIIGTNDSVDVGSTASALLQVEHSSGNISAAFYSTVSNIGPSGVLSLGHCRGSASGSLIDNDILGEIRFAGSEGTDLEHQGAKIKAEVNGTPASNELPTDLVFMTNSGASSVTERMRLDKNGSLGIGVSTMSEKLHVSGNILATGTITPNSDIAFKKDIKPLTNALNKVTQLLGINFTYKNNNEKSMGLLAQDVEKVFPELIRGEQGNKSLNYMGLTGALIEAIKELSAKVEALEAA